jgi:hypothetical protein
MTFRSGHMQRLAITFSSGDDATTPVFVQFVHAGRVSGIGSVKEDYQKPLNAGVRSRQIRGCLLEVPV